MVFTKILEIYEFISIAAGFFDHFENSILFKFLYNVIRTYSKKTPLYHESSSKIIISGFGLVFISRVPVWKENFKVHNVGCVGGHDGVDQLPKMTKNTRI